MTTIGIHPYNNIAPPSLILPSSEWILQNELINIPANIKTRDQLRIYVTQVYGSNIIEMESMLKYISCYHKLWMQLYPSDPYIYPVDFIKELKIMGLQCYALKNDYKEFFT